MNLTVTGTTFTDFAKTDVGSVAFRLEHDYFTKQDLVIRTAAGGGGTLLVEDVDFTLAGEDTYLSTQVTAAIGSGRNVMLTIQIINATYETGALYFSGKYIADAVEATDVERVGYAAKSANFTVRRDDCIRTFNITSGTGGAGDVTGVLPVLDGTNGRIRFVKVDTGTNKAIMDGSGTEKIGVEGNALTFDLYVQGDWVEVEDMGTYWAVVATSEPEIRTTVTNDTAVACNSQTWTNFASIALPAGRWRISVRAEISMPTTNLTYVRLFAALSTANNSASDNDMKGAQAMQANSSVSLDTQILIPDVRKTLAAATTLYLNLYQRNNGGGAITITLAGIGVETAHNSVISARRFG